MRSHLHQASKFLAKGPPKASAPLRQRDIFPLPLLTEVDSNAGGASRCAARRLARRGHLFSWANDGIRSLNSLAGTRLETQHEHSYEAGTRASLLHIANAYDAIGGPPTRRRALSLCAEFRH